MPIKTINGCILLALLLIPPIAGCSRTVRKPQLCHPGTAGYQQYNAIQFDPYPQNDMGPEIVGGRPRAYMQPPPEVIRARQHQSTERWRGPTR